MNAWRGGARWWALFAVGAGLLASRLSGAVFQSGAGRFEVVAADAAAAQYVTALADEAWRLLAVPLALPAGFPSPIFVRLVPLAEWREPTPFRTIVEIGGVVTLRLAWGGETRIDVVRRALVQALLMRQGVAWHGVNEKLTAPLWLELGGVEWWVTRSDAAQLDRLKLESARITPPAVADLLMWQRGAVEPAGWPACAAWLLGHLQAETTRGVEWHAYLRRLLAGDEPLEALAAAYPGRFSAARERELWWQVGFQHLRRARTLPSLTAAESREALESATRFVALRGDAEQDRIFLLGETLAQAQEPFVRAELQRRSGELNRVLSALHPFFRNAGLSLAEAFATRRSEAVAAFERDWRDALELQAATTALLDARENSRAR